MPTASSPRGGLRLPERPPSRPAPHQVVPRHAAGAWPCGPSHAADRVRSSPSRHDPTWGGLVSVQPPAKRGKGASRGWPHKAVAWRPTRAAECTRGVCGGLDGPRCALGWCGGLALRRLGRSKEPSLEEQTHGLADRNADFGNGWYNDHHFHYGYFIYASAAVGKANASFVSKWDASVRHLVRRPYSRPPPLPHHLLQPALPRTDHPPLFTPPCPPSKKDSLPKIFINFFPKKIST